VIYIEQLNLNIILCLWMNVSKLLSFLVVCVFARGTLFIQRNDTIQFSNDQLEFLGFRTGESFLKRNHSSGIDPCRDKGECFSGAWFGQSIHLVTNRELDQFYSSKRKYLMKRTTCEDASNWFMHKMFRHKTPNYLWGDIPGQTIDVFDFSGCNVFELCIKLLFLC
jgi:hypothetical protein